MPEDFIEDFGIFILAFLKKIRSGYEDKQKKFFFLLHFSGEQTAAIF